jgi:hypothetical protein
MNKKILLFLILGIFLMIPFVSSIQIDMKENYKRGETIIAKISGNFLDSIKKSNINFYRRHMTTTFDDFNIKKIEDNYYLYIGVPLEKIPDNYSISIKGVSYMKEGKISKDEIKINFTIMNESTEFTLTPGLIYTSSKFYLEVQNLLDENLIINIEENEEYASVGTTSGTNETEKSFWELIFGKKQNSTNVTETINYETNNHVKINFIPGETKKIWFEVENRTEFKTITLSSSNQIYNVPIYIIYTGNATANTNSDLSNFTNISEDENGTIILDENITESNNTIIIFDNKTNKSVVKFLETCDKMGGIICNDTQECNGTEENSLDANCCIGECKNIEKSNIGKTVGWILLGVVLVIIIFVMIKKSNKKSKPVNLLDVGKKK